MPKFRVKIKKTEYWVSEVEIDTEHEDYVLEDAEEALAQGKGTKRCVRRDTTSVVAEPIEEEE